MNTLNVEYRKVEALIPYARNPRTHAESQIAKIAASIVEYGWTNPILVDGDNGIIAGHGRLAAARKLGLDQVPVIELAHLTVAQKRALVIADNRLALDAGWDEEMLALELAELSDAGYDLALTGFEEAEIEALLTSAVAVADDESESDADEPDAADDVPEVPVMAVSRPGDVWAIGPHRLICGDATDRDVVAALMQGEVSRLCFTSPPYGNQRDYTSGGISDWDGLMRGVFAHLPMAGDGQVTLGETVIKGNARKVRRISGGKILAGFAGSTADAFSLLTRFETKLEQFQGQLERAAIELSKDWRTDKYLRNLEALLIVSDGKDAFLISGKGDVISSDDGLLAVGSGSMYALSAARALLKHTQMNAREVAEEALRIAGEICIYTNLDIIVEEI